MWQECLSFQFCLTCPVSFTYNVQQCLSDRKYEYAFYKMLHHRKGSNLQKDRNAVISQKTGEPKRWQKVKLGEVYQVNKVWELSGFGSGEPN